MREMIFDGVLEAEANMPVEQPGVWLSAHDIPRGTLVQSSNTNRWLLYVTMTGKGWWFAGPASQLRMAQIDRDGAGWSLRDRDRAEQLDCGPFTEVLP